MKKTFLFLMIVLYPSVGFGQNVPGHDVIATGITGTFFGSGDVLGVGLAVNYDLYISDYISISPTLRFAFGSNADSSNYDHISSIAAAISLTVTPMPHLFGRLKLAAGPLYHHMVDAYGRVEEITSYGSYYSRWTDLRIDNLWGILLTVRCDIISTPKLVFGIRGDMYTSFDSGYYNCDSIQPGIYMGFKL